MGSLMQIQPKQMRSPAYASLLLIGNGYDIVNHACQEQRTICRKSFSKLTLLAKSLV
jgi:hypothetical protein